MHNHCFPLNKLTKPTSHINNSPLSKKSITSQCFEYTQVKHCIKLEKRNQQTS